MADGDPRGLGLFEGADGYRVLVTDGGYVRDPDTHEMLGNWRSHSPYKPVRDSA